MCIKQKKKTLSHFQGIDHRGTPKYNTKTSKTVNYAFADDSMKISKLFK